MKKIEVLDKIEKINYITPPSTVVLISTISKEGITNLAPFGMFMVASSKPPMVAIGISPKTDTYRNICDTGEFVVSFPNESILKKLYKCGEKIDSNISEFELFQIDSYKSNEIKPLKVIDCCVNLECRLSWEKESGNHHIVCGNVIGADIDDKIFNDELSNDELRLKISSIYHITGSKFCIGFKENIDVDDIK